MLILAVTIGSMFIQNNSVWKEKSIILAKIGENNAYICPITFHYGKVHLPIR